MAVVAEEVEMPLSLQEVAEVAEMELLLQLLLILAVGVVDIQIILEPLEL